MPLTTSAVAPWGGHLFTPANHAGFLVHLPLLGAKNVILDLEYATKLEAKHDARRLAGAAIAYIRELSGDASIGVTVRTNMPRAWPLLVTDLEVLVAHEPDCLRIPAVEHPQQVEQISAALDALEAQRGLTRLIALHPMIENPEGLAHIHDIATASPRVDALALGGEDWVHACGARRTRPGHELDYVRQVMVAAAARAGVAAIDTIYKWLDDPEGLEADCLRSRELGFHGRAATNPRQLAPIDRIYVPDAAQRSWAANLLEGLATQTIGERELLISNGVILDPLAVDNARRIASYPGTRPASRTASPGGRE